MNRTEIRKKRWIMAVGIVGCVTMILLLRLVGALSVAYFASAFQIYMLLQVLFTGGMADYMARMVRSRVAKEQYKNADKVVKGTRLYGLSVGIAGALVLLLFAGLYADRILRVHEAALTLRLLAPVFFLDVACTVMQGYFQGLGSAVPTVICKILKQAGCLVFALLFSRARADYGRKIAALLHDDKFTHMYGASGIAIGFMLATAVAALFLLLVSLGAAGRRRRHYREGMRLTEDGYDVLVQFIRGILPEAGAGFLFHLGLLFGLVLYRAKCVEQAADFGVYGTYFGGFLAVNAIVLTVFMIAMAGTESAVAAAMKREEYKNARSYLSGGIQFLFFASAFIAAVGFVMSDLFAQMLFQDAAVAQTAASCMRIGFLVPIFWSMGICFSRILCGIGMQKTMLLDTLGTLAVYIVASSVAMGIKGDIAALVWAAWISGAFYCLLNGFFVFRALRFNPEWFRLFVLPLLAAVVIGLCMFLLQKALVTVVGAGAAFMIGLVAGAACYLVLLFVLKCVNEKDLYVLPGGGFFRTIGNMLHFL